MDKICVELLVQSGKAMASSLLTNIFADSSSHSIFMSLNK